MTDIGRSATFRTPGRLERLAGSLRAPLARVPFRAALTRAYEGVLERVAAKRLVCHFPNGERIRVAAAYRHITWNPDEYAAFRAGVRPGDVVFDLGANVGAYTILFAQWAGAGGRVFAFEPGDAARRGLERHAALNGVADRVIVRAEAVSAAPGSAWFAAHAAAGANRLVRTPGEGVLVPTTSIDAICHEAAVRPAFIKIDVEGAELDVLRGARETIARGGPDLRLYVEMHPHLWPSLGFSRSDVEAELAAQGLCPERLDGGADVWGLEGVCLRLRRCAS